MIVWHSALATPSPVGGVGNSVARLARGLGRLGHHVVVLEPGSRGVQLTESDRSPGVTRAAIDYRHGMYSRRAVEDLARIMPPDIVHTHWAFRPQNTRLARWAMSNSVPYIVHPRGALHGRASQRRGIRKSVYLRAVEQQVFDRSSAAIGNTPGDIKDLMRLFPDYGGLTEVIPNAVVGPGETIDPPFLPSWGGPGVSETFRCAYLGRWDVEHKGLDRLAEIARAARDHVSIDLYTDGRPTTKRRLETEVMASLPENVTIRPPVYGDDKWRTLQGADAYVQTSRWESFGNAVAEAIVAGRPVFLSREMYLAEELGVIGACHVIDADRPQDAARTLVSVLSDPDAVRDSVAAGRPFARSVHEDAVAKRVASVYAAIVR